MRIPEWIITGERCSSSRHLLEAQSIHKADKAALVLPHGNVDVEGAVSVNSRVVTAERNKLGEDTINGLRATKDKVKFSDPRQQKPGNVPLNSKILSAAKSACFVYQRI